MNSEESTSKTCGVCLLPKATLTCANCEKDLCKKHAERPDTDAFSFLTDPPAILKMNTLCGDCYENEFMPEKNLFDELSAKAREVGIWSRAYRGRVPVLKKSQEWIEFKGFRDRKELYYRLGFRAAEMGFNGVMQVEMDYEKVRDHAYQKTLWHARGLPVMVDADKIAREEDREVFWRELFHR